MKRLTCPASALLRFWGPTALLAGVATLLLSAVPARAEVLLGLCTQEADKHNVEFQQYGRMIPAYRENGIRAAMLEFDPFFRVDATEDQLVKMMQQFNVVHLATTNDGVYDMGAAGPRRAAIVGQALARYVEGGGGLFLDPQSVRYPNTDDEKYWNLVLAPLGLSILHEGVFDKTRAFEGTTLGPATFFYTRNIQAHPVTAGVSCLYLPLNGYGTWPGVALMQYSPEWQVVVRGDKEAKSYRSDADNVLDLKVEGSVATEPPVLAVRALGQGRIVSYALSDLFTGRNHRNPMWSDLVEVNGDRNAHQASDSMKMQMNAYKWLAEPSTGLAGYGTYRAVPYQPVQYPTTVDWDRLQFAADQPFTYPDGQVFAGTRATDGVRGIFGAHSSYSDGTGTVAEYVQAAQAAGLSFIVFADPLEKLTAEKLDKLKADCAAASAAGDFYACPGVEFTDGIGNRCAIWSEKVKFPEATCKNGDQEYVLWDGQVVRQFGYYDCGTCGFAPSAVLDYQALRQNRAHLENQWLVFDYLPFVYEGNKLLANNTNDYLTGLRDLRWLSVASFTRVRAPSEVAAAAATCFTGAADLATAKQQLNANGMHPGQYVSQGPVIAAWQQINAQMEQNWRYTRGAQRVRLWFSVRSDVGLAEVKVLDADRGAIRRFRGNGAKELSREFEIVADEQHYPVLQVIDTTGKQAISQNIMVYCYKAGLFRCGDNCNVLGATAMIWHPDRNQLFNAAKDFRNGAEYALTGWDTGSAALGVPSPAAYLSERLNIKEAGGWYPPDNPNTMPGIVQDMGLNSYNMQIVTMRSTALSESPTNPERAGAYMATVPRDVGPLEYYDRTYTLYAPMERVDMFTTFNYRRPLEGLKDYRGGILWHEGEIRFKQDCTLSTAMPIPLLGVYVPTDLVRGFGTALMITDADGSAATAYLRDDKTPISLSGRLRPGSYAALMTTPVGYNAVLAPPGQDLCYNGWLNGTRSGLSVGLGRDGQKVKAGTVLKYRFAVGTFTDRATSSVLLEHTVKALNMGGGHDGYPVAMKVGSLEDATFFFTARAVGSEAAFVLGPQSLMIDLPIRVRGLQNNGCAAVYAQNRPWYRFIPVDAQGTGWFQESLDAKNDLWVGNVFVCDQPAVRITLVVDGQAAGQPPMVELHNPTDQAITTTVRSPAHAPLFGGLTAKVTMPAGDSLRLVVKDKQLVRRAAAPAAH
ncbi:MAG TPA: hypothetical protein VGM19_08285 [Armatimonadota bacterium]|jgi:hypothetical protein